MRKNNKRSDFRLSRSRYFCDYFPFLLSYDYLKKNGLGEKNSNNPFDHYTPLRKSRGIRNAKSNQITIH